MGKITLLTGGTRSGKSSLAQTLAESQQGERFFIATCPSIDIEMAQRVARHKEERFGHGWITVEEETDLVEAMNIKLPKYPVVVLLDCITLWVNNLMYEFEKKGKIIDDHVMAEKATKIVEAMVAKPHRFFIVTNEVGLGIVPENAAARRYRDLVGTANQTLARFADEVIFVSCGIPLYIKGS